MLNCIYKGESISSLIAKEEKEYEKRKAINLELREASRKGLLLCEECGKPVQFRHGEIRLPYFAHQLGYAHECDYEQSFKKESKAHKTGKEILYNYFRELYPFAKVRLDYRLENMRRANIYVELNGQRLAVEFERFDIDIEELQKKHKDYKELGLNALWVICSNPSKSLFYENERDLHIFKQVLMIELSDVLVFLDIESKEFELAKSMEYRDEEGKLIKDKLFRKRYSLAEIIITLNGKLEFSGIKSYFDEFEDEKVRFIKASKDEEVIRQHEERWRKIREDRAKKEAEEKAKKEAEQKMLEEQIRLEKQRMRELQEDRRRAENTYVEPENKSNSEIKEPEEVELKAMYDYRIQKAKNGNTYCFDFLVKGVHHSPKAYKVIRHSLKEQILKGDKKAEELYVKIMSRAGFPLD